MLAAIDLTQVLKGLASLDARVESRASQFMKSMKRAERRRELAKRKRRAKKICPWMRFPEKAANNMAMCSCPACGNPRKWFNEKHRNESYTAD
jgi:hypothetical protein